MCVVNQSNICTEAGRSQIVYINDSLEKFSSSSATFRNIIVHTRREVYIYVSIYVSIYLSVYLPIHLSLSMS